MSNLNRLMYAWIKQVKNILGVVVVIYLYVLLRLSDKDELLKFYSTNEDMILFLNFPRKKIPVFFFGLRFEIVVAINLVCISCNLIILPLLDWQQRGLLFLILFLFLLSLGFSIVVWLGAKQVKKRLKTFQEQILKHIGHHCIYFLNLQHHYRKLRYWFIYQLTLLLLYTALHVWMFFYGWFLPDRPRKIVGSLFFIFFLNYLWQGYHLYVTALLMTDITFQAGVLARNRFNFTNVQTDAFNRSATYRR